MSISFFIGPFLPSLWEYGNPDPCPVTDLRIDPEEYSRMLFTRWPHAKRNSEEKLSWTINVNEDLGFGLRILLHPDLQYVSFGLGPNFTDFILWHRKFVPEKYTLFFHNSSSWDSLKLIPEITREEIQKYTTFTDI